MTLMHRLAAQQYPPTTKIFPSSCVKYHKLESGLLNGGRRGISPWPVVLGDPDKLVI